ncbi:endonuclease/exonuclease/phosphatase family protein [Winogradskyella schleiferi]|uniref:endonuclease/exonuclease/phosphatase family protein n=1 Tax=Winogradskyella schleiferi TaxID=2686078 RepID=UPI0021D25EB2|nr:hypothetical protein [Winogradskyella schleiferi]
MLKNHNFQWNIFDHILFSTNFFNTQSTNLVFSKAKVFNIKSLKQYHSRYKGQPFRTYVGKKYKGEYSDHLPVYIQLKST